MLSMGHKAYIVKQKPGRPLDRPGSCAPRDYWGVCVPAGVVPVGTCRPVPKASTASL